MSYRAADIVRPDSDRQASVQFPAYVAHVRSPQNRDHLFAGPFTFEEHQDFLTVEDYWVYPETISQKDRLRVDPGFESCPVEPFEQRTYRPGLSEREIIQTLRGQRVKTRREIIIF